jgi:hypothetical protein
MITIKLTDAEVSALECREGGGFDEGCQLRWAWMQGRIERKQSLVFACAQHLHAAIDSACEYSNAEEEHAEEARRHGYKSTEKYARAAGRAFHRLAVKLRKAADKIQPAP